VVPLQQFPQSSEKPASLLLGGSVGWRTGRDVVVGKNSLSGSCQRQDVLSQLLQLLPGGMIRRRCQRILLASDLRPPGGPALTKDCEGIRQLLGQSPLGHGGIEVLTRFTQGICDDPQPCSQSLGQERGKTSQRGGYTVADAKVFVHTAS